jgi:cation diffusion facilitator family transporter
MGKGTTGLVGRAADALGRRWVEGYDRVHDQRTVVGHACLAGGLSIAVLLILFAVRLWLGLAAGAVSVVAASFTLLSDLLASVVLVLSFRLAGREATEDNPFGHGRMEQVAPLLISFLLFFLGVEIARESLTALSGAHHGTWWPALPWVLLATAAVKQGLGLVVRHLGRRVHSEAIEEAAAHLRVEGIYTLAVIGGLLAGHGLHLPWLDGTVGLAGSAAIFYLAYRNARHALVPLLGQAPTREFLDRIREVSRRVPEVSDVHEIVVHEYGRMRVISLHAEIPEKAGTARMHGIAERLEEALRREIGGDVVVHSDPLMEMTPEVARVEERLREVLAAFPRVKAYHDFRVVAHSEGQIIIIADLATERGMGQEERTRLEAEVRQKVREAFPELAYSVISLSSRFSY